MILHILYIPVICLFLLLQADCFVVRSISRFQTKVEVMPSSSKVYGGDSRQKVPDAPINEEIKLSPVRLIVRNECYIYIKVDE